MKTITQTCDYCKEKFEQPVKEFNRKHKKGITKNFCSLSCFAHVRNVSMTPEFWQKQYKKQKKTFDIKSQSGNRLDEFSPFRTFLNSGRASIKKHKNEINIDVTYLKEQWERQNGICPYTRLKMILPKTTSEYKIKSLRKASLDRIDSSKGYIKGNVEFVCMAVNLAKVNHTKEEMIQFFKDTLSINQAQPT